MPLSGFKTPNINSSKWKDFDFKDEVYGKASELFDKSPNRNGDVYPGWGPPNLVPITIPEIEGVFLQLMDIFGFQFDNTRNMFDYFLLMLDSRSSRIGPIRALRSIHADYIGGINANFRKWYFAAQLDIDDEFGFANVKMNGKPRDKLITIKSLQESEENWANTMNVMEPIDCVVQVALYLLCWGEANNIRFMPECLCFIFKCCNDYFYNLNPDSKIESAKIPFLDQAITPLYNFYRDQSFKKIEDSYVHVDKDHKDIIGYDDMNQLFWYRKGLERITLDDRRKLIDLAPEDRYLQLHNVVWKKTFIKTFKETRSWAHVVCNFNRIWIIHISMFWYYTSFNAPNFYTQSYNVLLNNKPTIQATLTVMAQAGAIACLICLIATICEWSFIPRRNPGAEPLSRRFYSLSALLCVHVAPTVYFLGFTPLRRQTTIGITVTAIQFSLSIITVLYLAITPLGKVFSSVNKSDRNYYVSNRSFILNFHKLRGSGRAASVGLWFSVFCFKFIESYFFLTLSLRDPLRELSIMKLNKCAGDAFLGKYLCAHQAHILLGLILFTDLVLFFLDTYLWFIVCNTFFSVLRSFYIGFSVWTPWRNIFSRLPKRIFSKIIFAPSDGTIKGKHLTSQVWNSIIISMYREHLLSIEHVQKLIYKQVTSSQNGEESVLKEPPFFVSQEDMSVKSSLFSQQSEAQRRITFFAQSLSTPMREIGPTGAVPAFTILVPHYSEKIMLSLREIIREEDQYSNITMLEYLKKLHPLEWNCFVRDTKSLAEEFESESSSPVEGDEKSDMHYYSVGFKIATPEYILRTRIWASLRTQTLYRTVSGFMNYSRAIKLLFDVENPSDDFADEFEKLEAASAMAMRKFRMIVSMQRLKYFSPEETESTEFLLRAYPELQIAYLDDEIDPVTGEVVYYSVLIDGGCPILENGKRVPKYKIKLSGNPILGDGKSDNQNHSLIFTRGEYIQLVDANQDNYLEECLKIRSVLEEFDEQSPPLDPYSNELKDSTYSNPVAIIGTREYIFSENIGVLGDVAAGKEQTFGTLFARTLAHIGGKLHYGHPDFLNAIFMNTRGGVSKAQKGLHLNEDVYAGMNVLSRGGRIKHCEYMQCGKGRDLGFGSILNFTTKIGAGMGEQMLSREHFYLSSKLPLDRFLSYYYAHPGFHLNNTFIVLSIKLFLIVGINIAVFVNESTICEYNHNVPFTDPRKPTGCSNLIPVVTWLERSILSIFIVFAIAFLPLFIQELMERGFLRLVTRLGKHFACLSPLFEIFVCRVYSESLTSDMFIGGARYIATGRGFATVRVPFAILYSRFANASLYYGINLTLMILFISMTMWKIPLIYFWMTAFGLLMCPWIFNPNQFSFNEFFLDYRNYLLWLSRGNSRSRMSSWIGFTRLNRSRITGHKNSNSLIGDSDLKLVNNVRPSKFNLIITSTVFDFLQIAAVGNAFLFSNSLNETRQARPTYVLLNILLLTFVPLVLNIAILMVLFCVSCLIGPLLTVCCSKFPATMAFVIHILAVVNHLVCFVVFWGLQNFNFANTVLGVTTSIMIQKWLFRTILCLFLSREFKHDKSNITFWSGKWIGSGLGWKTFTQPFREFTCKITEMSYFAADVLIGHTILLIQLPILFIPYIDKWHTLLLFWLTPSSQLRPRFLSKKQRRKVSRTVNLFFFLFILISLLLVSPVIGTLVANKVYKVDLTELAPDFMKDWIQPQPLNSSRKGLHKGLIKNY